MKYSFGVMSHVWTLESEDEDTAFVSMSLFIAQQIPIAVYFPINTAIDPMLILQQNKGKINSEKIRKCLSTIKAQEHSEVTPCRKT